MCTLKNIYKNINNKGNKEGKKGNKEGKKGNKEK